MFIFVYFNMLTSGSSVSLMRSCQLSLSHVQAYLRFSLRVLVFLEYVKGAVNRGLQAPRISKGDSDICEGILHRLVSAEFRKGTGLPGL